MANNFSITQGSGTVIKATDNASVYTQHVNVDTIAAGDNNIGNVDIASAIPAGTNIIGAVKQDVINYTAFHKPFSYTGAQTDTILWSPTAGKKWVVTDFYYTTSAAAAVSFEDDRGAGDVFMFGGDHAANGGGSANLRTPIFSGEADADLIVTTSAGNLKGYVTGYETT